MATTSTTAPSNLFPFELVRPELERVEVSIREQVRGFDPAIEPYVAYICNTSGKRIRPALAILVGGAAGGVDRRPPQTRRHPRTHPHGHPRP